MPDAVGLSATAAVRVAGVVPFSSVDWPGRLCAVIFLGGCPWRCEYCHNPHLQQRGGEHDWGTILEWLDTRRGLLDGVVFSGGEPLTEAALPAMIQAVRERGFAVGLHTAGIYPRRLGHVLPLLDWVGLDIKSDAIGYDALTGRQHSHAAADTSLELLLASGVPHECRTTWSPHWLSEERLLDLARALAARGVRHYAVQNFRPQPGALSGAILGTAVREQLHALFARFDYR